MDMVKTVSKVEFDHVDWAMSRVALDDGMYDLQ